MKILLIARTCPWPANDGEKIRVFNLIKHLSHHEITVVCRAMTGEQMRGASELKKYCNEVHAVYIPRPHSASEKIRWVLPFLVSRYPISLSTVFFREMLDVARRVANSEVFDIVQVEHSSLAIYLDFMSFRVRPKKVLTMHNISHVRNSRIIKNLPFGVEKLYQMFNQVRFGRWEMACMKQFDCVITMSEVDREMLKKEAPSVNMAVVANGVDTTEMRFTVEEKGNDKRANIVFVGSMDSESNHDGAMFFLKEIFPKIKEILPRAIVYFVGRNPKRELANKHNGNDIVVTGTVESVRKYYQMAAVAVVPLRSGGGTRLKILEAMSVGVPVVSTKIGAEGIKVTQEEDVLLADTPEEFAEGVVKLISNETFRRQIVEQARKKVEQEYDWAIIGKQHEEIYRGLRIRQGDE